MKHFIHLAFATGHLYEIPVQVIAENRATYYHKERPEEFPTLADAMKDTVDYFDDAFEIKDWASNNMNWSDLELHARLVRFTPPARDFNDVEWSFHDHAALVGELDEAEVLQLPLDMILNAMAANQQVCNVSVVNGPDKVPFAALVVVLGESRVINTYVEGMLTITNHLAAAEIGAAAGAPKH